MKNKYEIRVEAKGNLTLDTKLWINGCLVGDIVIYQKDWLKFIEDHSLKQKLRNKYRVRIIYKSKNINLIRLFINKCYAGILEIKYEDWDNFISDHKAEVTESKIV